MLLIFFVAVNYTTAQVALPFKAQKEFYIYGNATVIGNTILGKTATTPFNDIALTNDDIDMVYTDIDNDDTTFSSSSATLQLPSNHTKIKYAVLYWAATYSYEKGYRKESGGQFLFQGQRAKNRSAISKVKIKLPDTKDYITINGDIVFDGANDTAFTLNSPYVCQADVTRLLKNASQINGDYTLANVTATQGFVSGGSAAGWLLYVVYEAPTENPQYITTFNGFAHVGNDAVKITFDNFKALEDGEIETSITLSALEGDSALIDDEILISNPVLKRMSLLSSNLRPRNNFFNSKITHDDLEFIQRNPASINTLGFDIATVKIPNQSQPIIDNNTEKVDLIFNTRSDRFYLFFTAFQTEISKVFYQQQQKETTVVDLVKTEKFNEDEEEVEQKEIKEERLQIITTDVVEVKPEKDINTAKTIEEITEISKVETIDTSKNTPVETLVKSSIAKPLEAVVFNDVKKENESRNVIKNSLPIVEKVESKEAKPWERKPEIVKEEAPRKESVYKPNSNDRAPENPLPKADYLQETKEKPLPIWLKQKQEIKPKGDNVYRPPGEINPQTTAQNSLALNRDNYEKLLTVEDYIYETQTFKRILNQEPTFIDGINKGYFIIATLVYDFDEAIVYQNELKSRGVNSRIFKDKGDSFYVYLYSSDNFYDVFMLRKAFIKVDFLSKVWILNINMKAGTLKKI
ncbi:MAG: hypothetical protein KBT58_11310 [Bizionia sp.]|nr:hypothetical protein [Bizionia sp.]